MTKTEFTRQYDIMINHFGLVLNNGEAHRDRWWKEFHNVRAYDFADSVDLIIKHHRPVQQVDNRWPTMDEFWNVREREYQRIQQLIKQLPKEEGLALIRKAYDAVMVTGDVPPAMKKICEQIRTEYQKADFKTEGMPVLLATLIQPAVLLMEVRIFCDAKGIPHPQKWEVTGDRLWTSAWKNY